MGNTCASIHIAWRGHLSDAANAVSRSYAKLGYERVKKAPDEGCKHVVLLARQSYVSVYDSQNASLDSGELKDLALAASKALKTAAVFTSLYDSDTYEFVVFANGRQVDLLMTDAESYDGPMKRLSDKARAAKWSSLFGRTFSINQINHAVTRQTAFTDDIVAGLSDLIGLRDGQPQINYWDFLDQGEDVSAEFYFKKKPQTLSGIPVGEIRIADYFDPDNCRMRAVYPANWPIPIGGKRLATWLMLSQGAAFNGGTADMRLSGPDTLRLRNAIISGHKFHNGQIVGALEPPARNLTQEDVARLVEAMRFKVAPVQSSSSESGLYGGEFPHLIVPAMTPERTTQILLVLQIDLEPQTAGEWEMRVSIQPGTQTEYRHDLPPLHIAAVDQTWLPVVSGLNPKTSYDKSNLSATHLQELNYRQSVVPGLRLLDHPAVTSSVAVLKDEGQATPTACKTWLEAWLRPLSGQKEGQIWIHGEKQMSASFHVGKTKKTLPVSGFLGDRLWGKLFDAAGDYQSVLVTFVPKGAECPIAGVGLQQSLKNFGETSKGHDQQIAETLGAMRGRAFDSLAPGDTWHVFKWVIHHADCYRYLETSARDMESELDSFAAALVPLQGWTSQSAWIPLFDRANGYERTVYEEYSVLNWFRGIFSNGYALNPAKMTAQWCGNVLRMVAPQLWLCRNLFDQVNRAALERVAQVDETNGVYKIALRPGRSLDELELALLPVLPVESVRTSML